MRAAVSMNRTNGIRKAKGPGKKSRPRGLSLMEAVSSEASWTDDRPIDGECPVMRRHRRQIGPLAGKQYSPIRFESALMEALAYC